MCVNMYVFMYDYVRVHVWLYVRTWLNKLIEYLLINFFLTECINLIYESILIHLLR